MTADDFRDQAVALGYPWPEDVFRGLGGHLRWEVFSSEDWLREVRGLGYATPEDALDALRRKALLACPEALGGS